MLVGVTIWGVDIQYVGAGVQMGGQRGYVQYSVCGCGSTDGRAAWKCSVFSMCVVRLWGELMTLLSYSVLKRNSSGLRQKTHFTPLQQIPLTAETNVFTCNFIYYSETVPNFKHHRTANEPGVVTALIAGCLRGERAEHYGFVRRRFSLITGLKWGLFSACGTVCYTINHGHVYKTISANFMCLFLSFLFSIFLSNTASLLNQCKSYLLITFS